MVDQDSVRRLVVFLHVFRHGRISLLAGWLRTQSEARKNVQAGVRNCAAHGAQHNSFVGNLSNAHLAEPEEFVCHKHPDKQSQTTQDTSQQDALHFRFSFYKSLWGPATGASLS